MNGQSIAEIIFAFLVVAYLVSGIDDLAIDLVYWSRYILRRLKSLRHHYSPPTINDLNAVPQQKAAIFVAAWREDDVIDRMLLHNTQVIDYENYDFFVGTYPNDAATQAKVDLARQRLPNVYKAVNPRPGPTCKADNLNSMYAELLRQERRSGQRYKFILMHDPEDVMHPLELKLCNYLIRRKSIEMVQTPVFPLEVPASYFTAGTYADEFAETHTKDMYVREWIKGFVPSAGVGTAISRDALERLQEKFNDKLFNTDSLTEDYDFSVRLKLSGLNAIFVRQCVLRPQRYWTTNWRTGKSVKTTRWVKEYIATRAHFPHTFKTAVRQRTRWSLGIIFQGWKNIGWTGDWRMQWLLFHDRKGAWTNLTLLVGYLFTLYLLARELLRLTLLPQLSPALPAHEWIRETTFVCLCLMSNRLLQRAIATSRIYGIKQGFLSLPRQIWGNFINVAALLRAARQFFNAERQGTKIAWDKTKHYFPAPAELAAYKRRLGDLLLENRLITNEQLELALIAQRLTGDRLGEALLGLRYITPHDLSQTLTRQSADATESNAAPINLPVPTLERVVNISSV